MLTKHCINTQYIGKISVRHRVERKIAYCKMNTFWRTLFGAVALASLPLGTAYAGQVVAIADGDTLTVLEGKQQIKVRLANIDAPEKKQPFGQRSRQSLADLCFRKEATLQVQDVDRYGRTVAVVVCDGIEANREQVDRGLAWVYPKYNKDRTLPAVEASAREAKLGLWRDAAPVPPWEWRTTPR